MLAVVGIPFLVLIATTFWDRFYLEETDICNHKNVNVHCFPKAIPPLTNEDLGISILDNRIDNCDKWNNNNVTFICFEVVNDFGRALADVGGLFTVFKVATKLAATIINSLAGILVNFMRKDANGGQTDNQNRGTTNGNCYHIKRFFHCIMRFFCKKTHYRTQSTCANRISTCIRTCIQKISCRCSICPKGSYVKFGRQMIALALTIIEMAVAVIIICFYVKHPESIGSISHHNTLGYKIFHYLNRPLIIFGMVTTSLFLPLEDYYVVEQTAAEAGRKGYALDLHRCSQIFKQSIKNHRWSQNFTQWINKNT